MKKQAAIVVSILFAVGTAAVSYAADTTKPTKSSDAAEAAKPMKPSDPLKVKEGTNNAPEGGIPAEVVTGKLLKIDGKNYVVKDQSGKEVHFQTDERTMVDANVAHRPKVGDQIRAEVMPQGYAYSIHSASDSTEAGTGPQVKSDPKSIKK